MKVKVTVVLAVLAAALAPSAEASSSRKSCAQVGRPDLAQAGFNQGVKAAHQSGTLKFVRPRGFLPCFAYDRNIGLAYELGRTGENLAERTLVFKPVPYILNAYLIGRGAR